MHFILLFHSGPSWQINPQPWRCKRQALPTTSWATRDSQACTVGYCVVRANPFTHKQILHFHCDQIIVSLSCSWSQGHSSRENVGYLNHKTSMHISQFHQGQTSTTSIISCQIMFPALTLHLTYFAVTNSFFS